MIKTVVGSFDTVAEAATVARELRAVGFLEADLNVIANNSQREFTRDATPVADGDASGAATGAIAGGALGGAAGLAVSLLGLAIPGVGPILAAGPIAAALAGAGAGAMAGGLIGGLTDLGVPEAEAGYYAEAVRRGGALVTVRADASRIDEVEAIMHEHGAFDIDERVEQWKSAGWRGYDPEAKPYSHDEIERDRMQYLATRGTTDSQLRR